MCDHALVNIPSVTNTFYSVIVFDCTLSCYICDHSIFLCPCLQVLALVFVRKLLDFYFTKRELSWLDDLMPESKKKKEDDKKKKAREKLVLLIFFFFCSETTITSQTVV